MNCGLRHLGNYVMQLPHRHASICNFQQFVCEFPVDVHILRWEIVWRNAPLIWRDCGSALPFETRPTQRMSVLTLSNEHGSHVKDLDRQQCCHNKHTKFPYRPTRDVSLLFGHAFYHASKQCSNFSVIKMSTHLLLFYQIAICNLKKLTLFSQHVVLIHGSDLSNMNEYSIKRNNGCFKKDPLAGRVSVAVLATWHTGNS